MSKKNHLVTARLAVKSNNLSIAPIIVLEVDDVSSGARIFELELNPLTLGNLITGSGSVAGTLRHMNEDAVGKVLETDSITIPVEGFGQKVPVGGWEQWEMDGWRCRRSDYGNHHRRVGDAYSVTRSRLVEKSDVPVKARVDMRDVVVAQALDVAKQHLDSGDGQFYLGKFLEDIREFPTDTTTP